MRYRRRLRTGLSAVSIAAQLGARVVLIESGEMGGECLNTGRIPSKARLAAAKTAHTIRASAPFSIDAAEPRVDFAAMHRHVREVIAAIAPHDSVERFEDLGAHVIRAEARAFVTTEQRKAHLIPAKVPTSICSRREHLFFARASEQKQMLVGTSDLSKSAHGVPGAVPASSI